MTGDYWLNQRYDDAEFAKRGNEVTRVNDVYEAIKAAKGGVSRDELAAELRLSEAEVQPAISELLHEHRIFELSVGTIGGDRFAAVDP